MHQVMGTSSYIPNFRRAKVALGNTQPRYNSHVEGIREKFYINSTRNSEQTPEWMSRTNSHYFRSKMKNKSLNLNNESNFMGVQQTYIYENAPKVQNRSGQFQNVEKRRPRNKWQMKNHTFEIQWPKKQQRQERITTQRPLFANNPEASNSRISRMSRDFTFYLPKYAIRQSPLHVQKATPIKIGHKSTIDTIHIK